MMGNAGDIFRTLETTPQIANTSSTWAVHFGISQVLLAYETDVNQ
jgi:hypothetical protein